MKGLTSEERVRIRISLHTVIHKPHLVIHKLAHMRNVRCPKLESDPSLAPREKYLGFFPRAGDYGATHFPKLVIHTNFSQNAEHTACRKEQSVCGNIFLFTSRDDEVVNYFRNDLTIAIAHIITDRYFDITLFNFVINSS